MSVGNLTAQPTPYFQQNGQPSPFTQLAQAISSGNLGAAQQAFTTFAQSQPQSQQQTGGQNNPFVQAISQIGAALSAGNIGQAQSALQALQSHRGGHHHHHNGAGQAGASDQSPNATASAVATATSSSNEVDLIA